MFKRLTVMLFAVALIFSASNLFAQKKSKKNEDAKTATEASAMPAQSTSKMKYKSQLDSVSYVIGFNWGNMLKRDSLMLDMQIIAKAMTDALFSRPTDLTEEQMQQVFTAFQKSYQEKNQLKAEAEKKVKEKEGAENKIKGDAYLEKCKKTDGFKATASGLQYKVLKTGTGKSPVDTSEVTVHYTGTLIDGTKFDSSIDRNEPATFPVNGVIKGWTEALKMMKEGDKWQIVIPSDIAYGPEGRPGIPPNSVLLFDLELIKVK